MSLQEQQINPDMNNSGSQRPEGLAMTRGKNKKEALAQKLRDNLKRRKEQQRTKEGEKK